MTATPLKDKNYYLTLLANSTLSNKTMWTEILEKYYTIQELQSALQKLTDDYKKSWNAWSKLSKFQYDTYMQTYENDKKFYEDKIQRLEYLGSPGTITDKFKQLCSQLEPTTSVRMYIRDVNC